MTNVTQNFNPEIGDKAAVYYFTDVQPCTVIKRTKKFVTVQMDDYKLNKDSKPEIIAGGFAGHCTNQRELKYDITRNENGGTLKFGLRENGIWCRCGDTCRNPTALGKGWRAFYDYNF